MKIRVKPLEEIKKQDLMTTGFVPSMEVFCGKIIEVEKGANGWVEVTELEASPGGYRWRFHPSTFEVVEEKTCE